MADDIFGRFITRFDAVGFERPLTPEEEADRHLTHEAAHTHVGEPHGLRPEFVKLVRRGVSEVRLRGTASPEAWCEVGVAGMLAEARFARSNEDNAALDLSRMGELASAVFDEVSKNSSNDQHGFKVSVPVVSTAHPYEPASCSVSDFRAVLNAHAFNAEIVLKAIQKVASDLNRPTHWQEFLGFRERFEKMYPAESDNGPTR